MLRLSRRREAHDQDGHILGNSQEGERAVRKFTQRIGILAAAAVFVGVGTTAQAQSDLLYDWRKVDSSTPVPPVTGYIPAPFVSTGNVTPAALSTLTANQTAFPGQVAVKIVGTTLLSPADNTSLFSNPSFQVNYAFMDYEGINGQATATAQANAMRTGQTKATDIRRQLPDVSRQRRHQRCRLRAQYCAICRLRHEHGERGSLSWPSHL